MTAVKASCCRCFMVYPADVKCGDAMPSGFVDALLNDHRWGLGLCSVLAVGVALRLYRQQALTPITLTFALIAIVLFGGGLILALSL